MDGRVALTASGKGWTGTVNADGYCLTVSPETAVRLPAGTTDPATLPQSTWVEYKATRRPNGSLLASEMVFQPFEKSDKEQKFAKASDFKIDPPDYDKGRPGKVHFPLWTMNILGDREIADHVTKVGQSLIPEWQKKLPDDDPAKVHFRFFVLQATRTLQNSDSDEAGTVLVPSNVLAKLKNDAQLAAILSADIAGAIRSDVYRSLSKKHTEEALAWGSVGIPIPGFGLIANQVVGSTYNSAYWKPLAEGEYRVGMSYMAAAGYDVRQAPAAIWQIEDKHSEQDQANGKGPSWLAGYLEFIYATQYAQTDWSRKQVGEPEYRQLLGELRTADPKAHIH